MYFRRLGTSVDYKLAMEWFMKAYNNGNLCAATYIGFLYEGGLGVAKINKTALKWYLEVAYKGEKCAQCNAGLYYEHGCGIHQDKQFALEWYEKSADQGHEESENKIKNLNEQRFYIDEQQKSTLLWIFHRETLLINSHSIQGYHQIEKDTNEQKSEMESLKDKLQSAEQKRLEAEERERQKDTEINLLRQEIQVLKLKSRVDSKQSKLDRQSIQQLGESVSKSIADWATLNSPDNSKAEEEQDNPENDIYYDK